MIDRRKTGINRVQIKDGNGGELDVYTLTANRIRVLAGALIAVLTVVGMVFAAVRVGVGVEVHQAIDAESQPGGIIDEAIDAKAYEFLEEVQAVIQDDLDVFEDKLQADHDSIVKIGERQIAIQEKMADDKEDLIREIRRAGSGGE